jgi:N utilization substance protein B
MLNRRLIRIRAMQSLYAFEQSRKANYLLAKEVIEDAFRPDLNSMEVQDKSKLQGYTKLGIQQLQEDLSFEGNQDDFESPKVVQKVVSEAGRLYKNKTKQDFDSQVLRTLREADKVFELYNMLLNLYLALAQMADKDLEHPGKSRLSSNKIVKELSVHAGFENQTFRQQFRWENEIAFIKSLYNQVLKINPKYIEYCEKRNHTLEEDIALLKYLVKNVFIKNELAVNFFEGEHLYWSEDKEILRAMVAHTFQNFENSQELNIAIPDDTWQERKDFLMTLFKNSINEEKELMTLIMPSLKNWDYDRIAETDKILLKIALVELMEFPGIPVKVTINEIIEIAKNYSTPKSGQFVNGVLDKISKDLVSNGQIKKSGRGMMDNK